jgi:hypothetical protein
VDCGENGGHDHDTSPVRAPTVQMRPANRLELNSSGVSCENRLLSAIGPLACATVRNAERAVVSGAYLEPMAFPSGRTVSRRDPSIQTASRLELAVVAAISSSDELVRGLADACPRTFSIEIGSDRIRAPVA